MKKMVGLIAALLLLAASANLAGADDGEAMKERLYALQLPGIAGTTVPMTNYSVPVGESNCGSGDYSYITYFCSCGGSCKKDKEYMCHNNCKCYDSYDEMPSDCTSYSVGNKE